MQTKRTRSLNGRASHSCRSFRPIARKCVTRSTFGKTPWSQSGSKCSRLRSVVAEQKMHERLEFDARSVIAQTYRGDRGTPSRCETASGPPTSAQHDAMYGALARERHDLASAQSRVSGCRRTTAFIPRSPQIGAIASATMRSSRVGTTAGAAHDRIRPNADASRAPLSPEEDEHSRRETILLLDWA